ncbi:MAG: hypothetical protein WAU33_18090 [Candidatus Binataceae bacterium]
MIIAGLAQMSCAVESGAGSRARKVLVIAPIFAGRARISIP